MCRKCSSVSSRSIGISGSTWSATPVSTSSPMPADGPPGSGDSISLVSSAEIRSAETMASRGASSVIAARSPGVVAQAQLGGEPGRPQDAQRVGVE